MILEKILSRILKLKNRKIKKRIIHCREYCPSDFVKVEDMNFIMKFIKNTWLGIIESGLLLLSFIVLVPIVQSDPATKISFDFNWLSVILFSLSRFISVYRIQNIRIFNFLQKNVSERKIYQLSSTLSGENRKKEK